MYKTFGLMKSVIIKNKLDSLFSWFYLLFFFFFLFSYGRIKVKKYLPSIKTYYLFYYYYYFNKTTAFTWTKLGVESCPSLLRFD